MRVRSLVIMLILLMSSGCVKVGPDFVRPDTVTSADWIEAGGNRLSNGPADYRAWWRAFNDPVLDGIIDTAYRQNLTLRIAGVRVLEARAQLGIAVGLLYPQSQTASGYYQYNRVSEQSILGPSFPNPQYVQTEATCPQAGSLISGGASGGALKRPTPILATVADYDTALVSLTADVATAYINIRTLDKRIDIARENVETQTESLKIAEARFRFGTTSERDVEQAKTILMDTKAGIPSLEAQLRQAKDALSLLLGLPPGELADLLEAPPGHLPSVLPRSR